MMFFKVWAMSLGRFVLIVNESESSSKALENISKSPLCFLGNYSIPVSDFFVKSQ